MWASTTADTASASKKPSSLTFAGSRYLRTSSSKGPRNQSFNGTACGSFGRDASDDGIEVAP